jgi:hypothetical protein
MEAIKVNLVNLCDVGTILGLPCVLRVLESINALMKFAHAKDVFICHYITIVEFFQVDLYKMCNEPTISFQPKYFLEFTNVVANTSYWIIQEWVIDLNDGT